MTSLTQTIDISALKVNNSPKRECGSCTVCCTVTRVPELNKAENVTCQHCTTGCTIYEKRPSSCRTFECAWLQGKMPDEMRPDLVGVMIEQLTPQLVLALPVPGVNWRTSETVKNLQETFVKHGTAVVASDWFALIPTGVKPEDVKASVYAAARKIGGFV